MFPWWSPNFKFSNTLKSPITWCSTCLNFTLRNSGQCNWKVPLWSQSHGLLVAFCFLNMWLFICFVFFFFFLATCKFCPFVNCSYLRSLIQTLRALQMVSVWPNWYFMLFDMYVEIHIYFREMIWRNISSIHMFIYQRWGKMNNVGLVCRLQINVCRGS